MVGVWTFYKSPQTGKVGAGQGVWDVIKEAQERGLNIRTEIGELSEEVIETVVELTTN